MEVSLHVQFIAHAKSWYFHFLFCYISHKENVPKRGVCFAWKDILFELLGSIFKMAHYT